MFKDEVVITHPRLQVSNAISPTYFINSFKSPTIVNTHSFLLFFIHHTESSEMGLDSFFLVGVELRVLDFYVVVLYM